MEKVYNFSYINRDNEAVNSQLIAINEEEAYEKLESMGVQPYELKIDGYNTFNINTLARKIPLRQLSRFYETMGKRIESGTSILRGLESSIEFTQDIRLKASISTLYNAMSQGSSMGNGMSLAQFPERHAKSVQAMESAGELDTTLNSLSQECDREYRMHTSLAKLLRMPKFFAVMVIAMFYAAFGFLSPMMLEKMIDMFGERGVSSFTLNYYSFVKLFSENIVISTVLYFSFFISIYLLGRSNLAFKIIDKNKTIHSISKMSDMAGLWLRYGLMYQAAINPREAAQMVGASAKREDSRDSFNMLESYLQNGYSIPIAVDNSNFPKYVSSYIKSGESGGDVSGSMLSMSLELFEDVDMLIGQLTDNLEWIVKLAMGVSVIIFFMLVYYPMLSTALSNV